MARYYGSVGFVETIETSPGIWEESIVERRYYGDVVRNSRRVVLPDKVNGDVDISNQVSIVADPYASQNFHTIRYATFMGTKWRVTDIEVEYPRLLMTLGGIYNEQT